MDSQYWEMMAAWIGKHGVDRGRKAYSTSSVYSGLRSVDSSPCIGSARMLLLVYKKLLVVPQARSEQRILGYLFPPAGKEAVDCNVLIFIL